MDFLLTWENVCGKCNCFEKASFDLLYESIAKSFTQSIQ